MTQDKRLFNLQSLTDTFLFFNYSLHSILFCIGFRCTEWWVDNHMFYQVFPLIFSAPSWHRAWLLPCYCLHSLWCTLRPHDCSVTTSLYFLMPLPFSLSPPTSFPLATTSPLSVSESWTDTLFFKDFIYLLVERGEGWEKGQQIICL